MRNQHGSHVTLDLDRSRRCGFPEVVYGAGKSVSTLIDIFRQLLADDLAVLATRITADKASELMQSFPDGRYNELAQTFRVSTPAAEAKNSVIRVGCRGQRGNERLADRGGESRDARLDGCGCDGHSRCGGRGSASAAGTSGQTRGLEAVVVVAGMEGALPSVVGGYVDCPVIAVPTSIGYGANFGGISALLSMLNSCAANVTVVNIDAGFKGGYVAGLMPAEPREEPRTEKNGPTRVHAEGTACRSAASSIVGWVMVAEPPGFTSPALLAASADGQPQGRLRPRSAHRRVEGMSGAIALAGMGALRSGAGLVRLAVPDVCLDTWPPWSPRT